MGKHEFLIELCARLRALPQEDIQRSLDFYSEMIDDRMEDGLTEEEAVAALGSMDEVVNTILAGTPTVQPFPQPAKPSRDLRWWEILLLVLGSPVWFSLTVAAAAVVFSVWISLWSVVISLYATAIALGISAIGCVLAVFFMFDTVGAVPVALGAALVCTGLAILLFMLSNLAAKGMIALTKLTGKGIKGIFTGKEQTV